MLTKPLRHLPSRSQTNNLNDFLQSQRHWHRNKKTGDKLPDNLWNEDFHGQSTCGANTAPHFPFTIRGAGTEITKSADCTVCSPEQKKAHEEPFSPLQWSLSKSEALAHRQCTLAHHLHVVFQNQLIHPLLPPCNLRSHLLIQVITLITKSLGTAHNVPTFRHQLIEGSGITLLLYQKHPSVR